MSPTSATAPATAGALTAEQAAPRLDGLTVIDVRTPAEYASGHLPGAHNVPLDQLPRALPALSAAAGRRELLVVCASGVRSAQAVRDLAGHGIAAATLTGGTAGWLRAGHALERSPGERTAWSMERQVRFTAGSLVLAGLAAGQLRPAARLLSAGVAGGLVLSAVTDTCTLAKLLARLPHNRARPGRLAATLDTLSRHAG
ncbi:rhodanese-like domain-containing protein [Streptomyces sp. G-G2]|uniref:rhodanese-like domain-containing protein n=1 Tax=Streptomyces sp. G-G2 TaxID=3046201 RepID=UPI0024BA3372|nr:rhodanese-like domain-containing protein [Streptomyces sp. G-G2]MDJ0379873.1 rhodanese-like domain-containing protein [Streptomyces sp. G-G2]